MKSKLMTENQQVTELMRIRRIQRNQAKSIIRGERGYAELQRALADIEGTGSTAKPPTKPPTKAPGPSKPRDERVVKKTKFLEALIAGKSFEFTNLKIRIVGIDLPGGVFCRDHSGKGWHVDQLLPEILANRVRAL